MSHHASLPRRAGLVLVACIGAGGASASSVFLAGDMPVAFVPLSSLAAAACGGIALRCRRSFISLIVTAVPLAFLVTWAAFVRPDLSVHRELPIIAIVAFVVAAAAVLAIGLMVHVAHKIRNEPSHDAVDRVFMAASLWLGVVVGSSVRLHHFESVGIALVVHGFASALGAGLAGWVLQRDLGRLRFLRTVYAEQVPGWKVVPQSDVWPQVIRTEPLRYIAACVDDGALLQRIVNDAPIYREVYRESVAGTLVAGVPLDERIATRALMRRAVLAALLLVTEGAAAVSFVWALGADAAALLVP